MQLGKAVLLAATFVIGFPNSSYAQDAMQGADAGVVRAARELCGGVGMDLNLRGTGNGQVALDVKGATITGTVQLSKSEWDGVEAMRHDAALYEECVTKMTPLLLDRLEAARQEKGRQQQACFTNCDMSAKGCQEEQRTDFNQCIEERRQRCLRACKNGYGLPLAECITKYCNVDVGSNRIDWPAQCSDESGSTSSCTTQQASCRRACQ